MNQRSKDQWDSYDIAGGIGLAHNLDGPIIIDFGRTYHTNMNQQLGTKRGTTVRICRVLGCRMSDFVRSYIPITITPQGLLRVIEKEEDKKEEEKK